MRHWLTQVVLLAACLVFLTKLPGLGSLGAALLASCLAVATAAAVCAAAERLVADRAAGQRQAYSAHA